jgi:hypothetical protein
MKYIKYFESFGIKEMFAFDMDDTLLNAPDFTDFCKDGELPDRKSPMGKIIYNQLRANRIDPNDVVVDYEIGELKVPEDLVLTRSWWRKDGWALVKKTDKFYESPDSLGDKPYPKMKSIYLSVDYNCIITGRKESLRPIVEENLKRLGLYPKNGLYMCPNNIKRSADIASWKSDVIKDLSKQYDIVNFYDDKLKWIKIIKNDLKDIDNVNLNLVIEDEIVNEYK